METGRGKRAGLSRRGHVGTHNSRAHLPGEGCGGAGSARLLPEGVPQIMPLPARGGQRQDA